MRLKEIKWTNKLQFFGLLISFKYLWESPASKYWLSLRLSPFRISGVGNFYYSSSLLTLTLLFLQPPILSFAAILCYLPFWFLVTACSSFSLFFPYTMNTKAFIYLHHTISLLVLSHFSCLHRNPLCPPFSLLLQPLRLSLFSSHVNDIYTEYTQNYRIIEN